VPEKKGSLVAYEMVWGPKLGDILETALFY
jgi:hypothetical protein